MQSVSSTIWTRVAVFIFYDDNHYTTATCLYCPSDLAGPPGLILCQHRAVVDWFKKVIQTLLVHVKGSTGVHHLWVCPYSSSSVACQLCLTWIVYMMGGRWPYSCCLVGCCLQDLFNTARRILVQLPSSFFSICFVSIHVVHSYSSIAFYFIGQFWLPYDW